MSVSETVVTMLTMVIGQDAGIPPAGGAVPTSENPLAVSSALDFVLKGGWPMVPIALVSLVALAIIIERAMVIRRSRVVPRSFVRRATEVASDPQQAMELCRRNRSPISRVFAEAIRRRHEAPAQMEKHVEDVGGRELVALRQRMRLLSSLPQVSTMLGLLGTVFGMIKTFQEVAASSEALGKTERLAEGIFEAWTCTAGGLFVAIPVLIAFHWLMGKIDVITADMDETASDFVERMRDAGTATVATVHPQALTRGGTAKQSDGVVGPAPATA